MFFVFDQVALRILLGWRYGVIVQMQIIKVQHESKIESTVGSKRKVEGLLSFLGTTKRQNS